MVAQHNVYRALVVHELRCSHKVTIYGGKYHVYCTDTKTCTHEVVHVYMRMILLNVKRISVRELSG